MKQSLPKTFLMAGVLIVITITAYLPAINAGYIWDDDQYVTDNPLLSAPDGLWRIWFTQDSPSQYFPATYTVLRLEYSLWKLNPLGYHLTNILLHCANALLVWLLLKRLSIPGSWFAAAVFALHPVNVESVAWITELKNILMLFFSLLSLLVWLRFLDESKQQRLKWYFYTASLLLFAVALFSKTTACTLPAALLLLLWLRRIPVTFRRLLQLVPFVLMALAVGLLVVWWEKHHQGTVSLALRLNILEKLLIASRALWFYLHKLFWPVDLAFSYPKWNIDYRQPLQYFPLVAWLIMALCMWRWWAKFGRRVIAAVIFFVATLFPVLGFFPLFTFIYTYVADHYQYMACIGPITLFVSSACFVVNRLGGPAKALAKTVGLCLLCLLALLTWRQCHIYKNPETLWRDTLRKHPESWMAHNNLATELRAQGKFDESITQARQALRLAPDNVEVLCNLAAGLQLQSNLDEAVVYYRKALQNPDISGARFLYADVYNSLGSVLLQQGNIGEALVCCTKAIELNPDHFFARMNLASLYARRGRFKEALEQVDKALKIIPGSPEALKLKDSILRQEQNKNP